MALAFLSAFLCAFLRLGLEGVGVGAGVYILSYLITRYIIKVENISQNNLYIIGAGTYAAVWLTFWFIFNTFLSA